MRSRLVLYGIITIFLSTQAFASKGSESATGDGSGSRNFANSDVIDLLKAGMNDSVIIAKIKQAPEVNFKLEKDDLIALKSAGASPDVISAMITRETPASDSEPRHGPALGGYGPQRTGSAILVTREGRKELEPSTGEMSTAGFAYFHAVFLNYPGLHANTKTSDLRPSILIHSEFDPNEHYYIGKLDPDTKINARSLKIKSKSRGFSMSAGLRPDEDWMVAYTATQEEKGAWKLTPKVDLESGEYGLFDGIRLFGFSVGQ
jgi:hypothetical protein